MLHVYVKTSMSSPKQYTVATFHIQIICIRIYWQIFLTFRMIGKIPAQTAVYNATVKSCCESTQQSRRKLSVSPPRPTVPFNNNNNNHDTYNAVIMTKVIARVHSVNLVNVEQRQAAADPQIKPPDLVY